MRVKRLVKWITIGFALFVFFPFLLRLRVMIEVRIGGEKSWLKIEISLWRKLVKRDFSLGKFGLGWEELFYKLWQMKKEDQEGEAVKNSPNLWSNEIRRRIVQGLDFKQKLDRHPWMKKLLTRGLRIRILRWKTIIGLGDPMSTAIATGLIWGAKGGTLALLTGLLAIPVKQIQVSPNYAEREYESVLFMELNLRIAYLLLFAAGAYIMMRSIRVNNRASVPHEQTA